MLHWSGTRRRTMDPHGYHPLAIDEDCLSDADRLEAFTGPTRPDWKSFLTRGEIESFEKAIKQIEQSRSPYWFGPRELPAVQEKNFEMVRLGMLRAYARDKYGDGRATSFGDGAPLRRPRE